ncbi:hypothetical protein LVD15_02880 [Fulvivirga maritima]|uniref:hypothetical protein n=1 Tax=Fulvivirga maritima TaxID=2904247 RepID=UPI001F2FD09F|nr:hypothetical protein [Fulvivirga maritima]UII27392.1 hypothetical protein LVD15_02880 [Fulvivirga maritima]
MCCGISVAQQFTLEDSTYSGIDTVTLLHTRMKVWVMTKKKFPFQVNAGDSLLYTLKKEKDVKMKYRIVFPDNTEKQFMIDDQVENMPLPTDAGAGTYTLEILNRSLKNNYVTITLKQAKGWTETTKIKVPIIVDSVTVAVYDTVPRLVLDDTYYLGARRNIKEDYRKTVEFDIAPAKDKAPLYWAFLIGFGREYGAEANNQVDIKTQQPVGDPLVAFFMKNRNEFPESESKKIELSLKGPGVNSSYHTTAYGTVNKHPGHYTLAVINDDEVVGEYVYFKVMAFDFVKSGEKKVPKKK